MARSPEYPDLTWVEPRSWSAGRASGQPTVIVIHTTEGHEKATSAEDGAAYDARRTDGTSAHYFHDQNSTVQCVRTTDRAHTARRNGNRIGIQHELCGRAGQTGAQWADAASEGTLRQAAKQCARDVKKWGIPVRKLSVAQVRSGMRGFCGHVDITYAFPDDGGTHTDPGVNFPWPKFLAMVQEFVTPQPAPEPEEEQFMIGGDFRLEAGYAFSQEQDGSIVLIDKELMETRPFEPASLKGGSVWDGKGLYISLAADMFDTDEQGNKLPEMVRIAIHDGSTWSYVQVVEVAYGRRTKVTAPQAKTDSAYTVSFGRVHRYGRPEGLQIPPIGVFWSIV